MVEGLEVGGRERGIIDDLSFNIWAEQVRSIGWRSKGICGAFLSLGSKLQWLYTVPTLPESPIVTLMHLLDQVLEESFPHGRVESLTGASCTSWSLRATASCLAKRQGWQYRTGGSRRCFRNGTGELGDEQSGQCFTTTVTQLCWGSFLAF